MTELPGTDWTAEPPQQDARPGDRLAGQVKHVFTHFTLMLDVVIRHAAAAPECGSHARWVDRSRLDQEALPTLMRNAIALAR